MNQIFFFIAILINIQCFGYNQDLVSPEDLKSIFNFTPNEIYYSGYLPVNVDETA